MLNAIAIDDEPVALEIIKTLSAQVTFIRLTECFTNPFKAMEYLALNETDLIFLDIKMPGLTGTDFLKTIAKPPMVIFTTAYSEHAVQSFELDAVDYLLKPFSLPRFLKACNKAHDLYELRKNNNRQPDKATHIFIKSGYEQIKVNTQEILYAESAGNYVKFVLNGSSITSRTTMNDVEDLLPKNAFIRIHRSFMVALNYITKSDRKTVWVGNTELPVGDAYAAGLEQYIAQNKKI